MADMQSPSGRAGASRDLLGSASQKVDTPNITVRQVALALLTTNNPPLSRKAGSFLGQCAVDDEPLSPKQRDWLEKLLEKAGTVAAAGEV